MYMFGEISRFQNVIFSENYNFITKIDSARQYNRNLTPK